MNYKIIFWIYFSFSFSVLHAQKYKTWKNIALYKKDSSVYKFIPLTVNSTFYQKLKTDLEENTTEKISDFIKYEEGLLIENIFLVEKNISDTLFNNLFEAPNNTILGPYKTSYGAFKLVQVLYSSAKEDTGKMHYTRVLDKEKASVFRLNRVANKILLFFKEGKGNINKIKKLYAKYKKDIRTQDFILDDENVKQTIDNFNAGEHFFIANIPSAIAVIQLQKNSSNSRSILYREFIVK